MALFEEQITDTLQTGAPSIKYEGDEGPQDPRQEQMLAQLKEEYMQYVFEQKEIGEPIMSFEEWYQMIYEASKMGVQAPQEEMSMEETMMREPAAYGGIMDTESGRRAYGLGSILKKITKIPKKLVKGAKKIVKSPIGKAGIAALLMGPAMGALGGTGAASTAASSAGPWTMFKQGPAKKGLGALLKKAVPHLTNPKTLAKIGIGAATALPFLGIGTQKQQDASPMAGQSGEFDFDYGQMIRDVKGAKTTEDLAALNTKYGTDLIEDINVYDYAQGGRIGYQEGSMVEKPFIEEAIWIEKIKDFIRKRRGERRPGSGFEPLPGRPRRPDRTGPRRPQLMPELEQLLLPRRPMPDMPDMPRREGYALGSKADFAIEDILTGGAEDEIGGITSIMREADLARRGNVGQFYAAQGGRIGAREGGLMDLGGMEKDYRNTGGFVELGAEEKADDVPARLSKNEFVMTADAVRGAGDGDIDKGASIMEDMMKELEQKGQEENMKMAGPDWYIKRIEHLMFLGYDYDEAAEIAYDSDRYYEVVGDPMARRQGAEDMFEVSERLSEVV